MSEKPRPEPHVPTAADANDDRAWRRWQELLRIAEKDRTLRDLIDSGQPVTREAYIESVLGFPLTDDNYEAEWGTEYEAMLPWPLQDGMDWDDE